MDLDKFALFQDFEEDKLEQEANENSHKRKQEFMKASQSSMTHHFQHLMREDIVPDKNPNDRSILAFK